MKKSDGSIKDVVLAAIQRNTAGLIGTLRTRIWDEGDPATVAKLQAAVPLGDGERPILYAYFDASNWTLVTTRRVCYSLGGHVGAVAASEIASVNPGDFKGLRGQQCDCLTIRSRDGQTHRCPFETGGASMGTLYAVMTLCKVTSAA